MKCKFCSCTCIKKGKQTNGAQKYYCNSCQKFQQSTYRYRAYEIKSRDITQLLKEGCGIRSISRILNITTNTVMTRIRNIARSLTPPVIRQKASFEVDELRTFIGNKRNEFWVTYSIDRKTGAVCSYHVGKRNKTNLRSVVKSLLLAHPKIIRTDGLQLYKFLIPGSLHRVKNYQINKIERKNLNFRTHLKRLSRRSICFSRSLAMLDASVKIYIWG